MKIIYIDTLVYINLIIQTMIYMYIYMNNILDTFINKTFGILRFIFVNHGWTCKFSNKVA